MQTMTFRYKVHPGDFRRASYYALSIRYKTAFRILFVVLTIALGYLFALLSGFIKGNFLIPCVAGAYLIWAVLLFANTERQILRYTKSPDSVLGLDFLCRISSTEIIFEIPDRKIHNVYTLSRLACVYEINSLFSVYLDASQTYLLPHRAMTEEERSRIRSLFQSRLGERFFSRELRKKKR